MRGFTRLAAVASLAVLAVAAPTAAVLPSALASPAPNPPIVTANFDQTQRQPIGATRTFTITQPDNTGINRAKEFVWGLDTKPPTSGQIPAGQTCTTTASSPACTKITNGTATLTISVPSPGPHVLWVYERNAAGADSAMTSSGFTGQNDPVTAFTSGASLSANFAAALAAHGNVMISSGSETSCGAGSGDGTGTNIDGADLNNAGWATGATVTADGATFTVPNFGTCGPDNVLSANQEIGTGPLGAQGGTLVFLAASTSAHVVVSGLFSGSPDNNLAGDVTAPAVPGGASVTGAGCTAATAFGDGCIPAIGTISYASGCLFNQTSYFLTVPDWQSGPSDIAALTLPRVVTTAGVSSRPVHLYAFAVPLDPSCTVTSVTLPDVGSAVRVLVAGSGSTAVYETLPGLHVVGMALRNSSTATPEANGISGSSPPGQAWTGAFASPVENAVSPPAGQQWGNQTIRTALSPNVSVPAGTSDVRIRLSNPGFLSASGSQPLAVGAASVAQAANGPVPAQTPVPLTFGGSGSVTIPEGSDVYSDPLALPFAVTAGKDLLISIWLKNPSLPSLPGHSFASGAQTWFAPATVPDETSDVTGTPFTGPGSSQAGSTVVLTGLDVTTPAATLAGQPTPGAPTVVVVGNNVIDGATSQAISDAADAPSDRLAGQLASQSLAQGFGVVDGGIESNRVLSDGSVTGGVSLVARVDRDILAEPDVGTVIIDEGLQDLLAASGTTLPNTMAPNMENAYQALETQLNGFGINVILGSLTPCAGYLNSAAGDSCTASVDAVRTTINTAIIGNTSFPSCAADFDAAVSNGASPEALASADNAGDNVNLTWSGYAALASAVFSSGCSLAPNLDPPPTP